ncbi:MAG: cell division protein FtsZ, partial [Clostridia bacterium]|nr:cell division protein FtsZ [Clostridia bacterium]
GTGASPVIAKYAREVNPEMLIISIVTKPFRFERNKMQVAEKGITKLQEYVDSLIIIPNQKLFDNDRNAIFMDAYAGADDILKNSIRSISDLINYPSIINVDFADVKTIMKGKGYSHIGMGECEGESNSDRMVKAVKMAANEDTLNTSIAGATGLIFSIQTGLDLTCKELDEADAYIASLVSKDVNYIFGHSYDQSMNRKVRVTLIATGCTSDNIPRNGNMMNGGIRPNFSGMRGGVNPQPSGFDPNQRPQVPPRPQPQQMQRPQQPQPQQPTRIDSVPRQEQTKDIPPFMKRLLNRK